MRSIEKVEMRELSATEVKQVSGGGYIGNTTPLPWNIPVHTPPKPLQG